jgi:hypothetical protein
MVDTTATGGHNKAAGKKANPEPAPDGDGAQELLWSMDAGGRWRKVKAPTPGIDLWCGTEAEVEAQAAAAGWGVLGNLGADFGASFDVQLYRHRHAERFLASCWVLDDGFLVLLDGFPALWRFLADSGALFAEGRADLLSS